ncbi:MAG: xanthine dehydrogenase family protein subunit M [Cytophagales bacterium]|nr:MAG: xanthine dehydrogenase family protein subunit M [Cytophagales bacterium]
MIPSEFDYIKAKSIDEAISLLKDGDAKLLAGGHSLIPAMKLRLNRPTKLIDISRIAEMKGIKQEDGELVIGAMTTHYEIMTNDLIKKHLPILSQAAELIGDVQVRNKGTLGGSLAHADPSADWPASMLVTDAVIVVAGAKGKRAIKAGDFFTGFFMTALEEGEIVTQIRIPLPSANTKSAYVKFMQPASRFAIVGCAVVVTGNGSIDDIKVAFTGVSESAFRDTAVENALKGKKADTETIKNAADQAAEGVSILSDHFAGEEYRKHLAKVYAKRALTEVA